MELKSQQNYFNVPSGEITDKKKLFFQHQINENKRLFQNNITLDYGLGHHFEAGINILGASTTASTFPILLKNNNPNDPMSPLILANAQKAFVLGRWSISAGLQAGSNSFTNFKMAWWRYGLIKRKFKHSKTVVTLGVYSGNNNYLGMGSKNGIMAGIDKPLYKYKKHFTVNLNADFISGSNGIAVAVPGLVFSWKEKYMLSTGAQLPVASKNGYAAVFEFTWRP